MDLTAYIGQYIKIFTQEQDWFIGELLKVHKYDDGQQMEYEFNCVISIKDQNRKAKFKGIYLLKTDEIKAIEELDPQVQQGIRLTVINAPKLIEAHRSMINENLPSRVSFGRIENPE
ncbi:hypothetical protein [Cohnella thailandensis]|uniref:Uncharacterized protein n=1 Tax=Cohnella thailandensis TaxID=557557 RepID=A0A841T8B3_9BACL|nr:hypothetical protein [Cohnella thailandensis]MBB6638300.1 hypothetical protein [Cohnella thailandensis]MBP1977221.1 hypothetical protein [Cohnella thailandensis]